MNFFGARQSKLISFSPQLLDGGVSAAEVAAHYPVAGLAHHVDVFAGKNHLVLGQARYEVTVPMSAWVYGA
eukprot:SAG31_NODE_978_length_10615_cov_4.488208_8_plen_71_part_00